MVTFGKKFVDELVNPHDFPTPSSAVPELTVIIVQQLRRQKRLEKYQNTGADKRQTNPNETQTNHLKVLIYVDRFSHEA